MYPLSYFQDFQNKVCTWSYSCFGEAISNDVVERNHRFIEESLELAQSHGITKDEVLKLVDYVFSRPTGEPHQELGGVMVTLAALCNAYGYDMLLDGEIELNRVWEKIDKIREKQKAKPKFSPLPQ